MVERALALYAQAGADIALGIGVDEQRLEAALGTAKLSGGATRYGPALKLAESILTQSQAPRREVVLISDFQKTGWSGTEDVHFPDGMSLTPVSVATETVANLAVPSGSFARSSFSRAPPSGGCTSRYVS